MRRYPHRKIVENEPYYFPFEGRVYYGRVYFGDGHQVLMHEIWLVDEGERTKVDNPASCYVEYDQLRTRWEEVDLEENDEGGRFSSIGKIL